MFSWFPPHTDVGIVGMQFGTLPHTFRPGVLSLGCTNKDRCLWGGGTSPDHVHGKFLPVFLKFRGGKVGLCHRGSQPDEVDMNVHESLRSSKT